MLGWPKRSSHTSITPDGSLLMKITNNEHEVVCSKVLADLSWKVSNWINSNVVVPVWLLENFSALSPAAGARKSFQKKMWQK